METTETVSQARDELRATLQRCLERMDQFGFARAALHLSMAIESMGDEPGNSSLRLRDRASPWNNGDRDN